MAKTRKDLDKLNLTGWRIEPRYSKKTLIGNWCEEVKVADCVKHVTSSTTHRADYKPYPNHKPDVYLRRAALKRGEGLPKQHIFLHQGRKTHNDLISWYDEQFNKRVRDERDTLPALRRWNGQKMGWIPERTDYPMQGSPTNFGLIDRMRNKWEREMKEERQSDYISAYQRTYKRPPQTSFTNRICIKDHFNPSYKTNKDLRLRDAPFAISLDQPIVSSVPVPAN